MWLALLAPAAVMVALVLWHGVNVPHWDDWELLRLLIRLRNGTLTWADLIAPHNEHRVLFSKLLLLALGHVTAWDIRAALIASLVLCLLHALLLAALARPLWRPGLAAAWGTLLLSAIVFSPTQAENWYWGWQVQWFIAALASSATVAFAAWSLAASSPWAFVAAAAFAAFVAQYDIASGLVAWPAGALVLAYHPRWRLVLPVWIAAAAAATAYYFVGYARPSDAPPLLTAFQHPFDLLLFIGGFLAGPFWPSPAGGLLLFALFLALALFCWRHWRHEPALVLPWIALGLLAVAHAGLTAVGRIRYGAALGAASRYQTIGLLLSVALVPLAVLAFRVWATGKPPLRGLATAGAVMLSVVVVAVPWINGNPAMKDHARKMREARSCVLSLEQATDDCLRRVVYPEPSLARHWIRHLVAYGWSGLKREPGLVRQELSLVDGGRQTTWRLRPEDSTVGWTMSATLDTTGHLTVSGWAREPRGNDKVTPRLLVVGGNRILGRTQAVNERPDVAKVTQDPSLLRSGWTLRAEGVGDVSTVRAYLIYGDDVLVPLDGEVGVSRDPG
jgi:hypothetical protein